MQEHGINMADIIKLKQAGLATVLSILMCTKKELLNIKGITEAKCDKLYEVANKIEAQGFRSGMTIFEQRKSVKRISTGSH